MTVFGKQPLLSSTTESFLQSLGASWEMHKGMRGAQPDPFHAETTYESGRTKLDKLVQNVMISLLVWCCVHFQRARKPSWGDEKKTPNQSFAHPTPKAMGPKVQVPIRTAKFHAVLSSERSCKCLLIDGSCRRSAGMFPPVNAEWC